MTNELLPLNDRDEVLWAIAKNVQPLKNHFLLMPLLIFFYGVFGFLMTEILETVITIGRGLFGLL